MTDFAKLFVREGVGQVLITREEDNDKDLPVVVVRIPDCAGIEFRITLSLTTDDYDKAELYANEIFANLSEDNIDVIISSMVEMRNDLIKHMQQEG